MAVALVVAAMALGWLLGQWLAGDAVFAALGYATHAITLLSIFALIAGLAVALLFRRFATVRSDLLAGRNVVARWSVDAEVYTAFAARAIAADRADKRGALLAVLFFVAVIFGLFALFDPEAAPAMLGMAVVVGLLMVAAYLLGGRVMRRQLEPASREVIVGTDGLLVNGVLHVWSAFLTWLADASLTAGPPASLVITYAYLARFGPQFVSVMLPVPPEAVHLAEAVVARLGPQRGRRGRPGRDGVKS